MRLPPRPWAIPASVFMEQGAITILAVTKEPLAMVAPISR